MPQAAPLWPGISRLSTWKSNLAVVQEEILQVAIQKQRFRQSLADDPDAKERRTQCSGARIDQYFLWIQDAVDIFKKHRFSIAIGNVLKCSEKNEIA